MREIIFRAKRKDNGEWVEGYIAETTICSSPDCYLATVIYEKPKGLFNINWHEVIPETIGQYTGLTDKNGKKTFEGDIVKRLWTSSVIIYCIKYEEESACFIGEAMNKFGFTTFDYSDDEFEVIGNIYDNPELIKYGG